MTHRPHQSSFDVHSAFRADQHVVLEHVELDITPYFPENMLDCVATYRFADAGETVLDVSADLHILAVTHPGGAPLRFERKQASHKLGDYIELEVPQTRCVVIRYRVSRTASGLNWLSAEQTTDKVLPYLYTQCQEAHARSILPCQDTPSVRITYGMNVRVGSEFTVASAADKRAGDGRSADGHYARAEMTKPIPSYLIAFAVGKIDYIDITPTMRVYAEPSVVAKAREEFEDLPTMMERAEHLFGPYPWGRCDILVMPDSFPYGGMENPCLMFVTPSLVIGDKSAVSVIAHELAHGWTGNLVTNATWGNFSINEGWTVYAEWRILEAMYGVDAVGLHMAVFEREFRHDLAMPMFDERPDLAALCVELSYEDNPDDVFTRIPYFKGAQFLRLLESIVGRSRFDEMIRTYIERFSFKSITWPELIDFFEEQFGEAVLEQANYREWVYQGGYPEGAPVITSSLVDEVQDAVRAALFTPGTISSEMWERWSAPQQILFLNLLAEGGEIPAARVWDLNKGFDLENHPNLDIRFEFFMLVLAVCNINRLDFLKILGASGRIKYVRPILMGLKNHPRGLPLARRLFPKVRDGYHPTVVSMGEQILES